MENKKKPHTDFEKQLLIQLIQPKLMELDNRRTDGMTIRKKQLAWEQMTREFNSSSGISQTVTCKQLKKMWQNLKTKARDAKTKENTRKKTGGGPQPPEIGPLEAQVLSAIPNVMPTIDVIIDSDIIDCTENQEEGDDDSEAWLAKKNRSTAHDTVIVNQDQQNEVITEPTPPPMSPQHVPNFIRPLVPSNTNPEINNSIEEIKKKMYIKEFENSNKKFELQIQQMTEKHDKEMEILEIKKQIALKELNSC